MIRLPVLGNKSSDLHPLSSLVFTLSFSLLKFLPLTFKLIIMAVLYTPEFCSSHADPDFQQVLSTHLPSWIHHNWGLLQYLKADWSNMYMDCYAVDLQVDSLSTNTRDTLPPSSELKIQPWRWRQYFTPKRCYLPTSLHGITTHNVNKDIMTAVRTSNLMSHVVCV
jgi:hypothetical protein